MPNERRDNPDEMPSAEFPEEHLDTLEQYRRFQHELVRIPEDADAEALPD